MILNTNTYRIIKNVLTTVPFAPSSAQLGEAMAAAWEFRSFHQLKQHLDQVETDLSGIPPRLDVHPDRMIRRLAEMGVDPDPCRSLALTMFLVQDGDFAVEMTGEFEELHGARAYRFDQTSPLWRRRVHVAVEMLTEHARGKAWHLPLGERLDWRHPEPGALDLASALRVIPFGEELPRVSDSRDLGREEFEQTDLVVDQGGHLPITVIENVLAMCQHHLPDGARHLLIGPTGIVVLYEFFEICLVEYNHREKHRYPALYPGDGPGMMM
jgi:hypothetical protein